MNWGASMDVQNILLVDEERCTGCGACFNVCPKHAISFSDNDEGFPSPEIDESLCIHCGLCYKKCPVLYPPSVSRIREAYAAQMKDKKALKNSTSGGVFNVLAQDTINNGGIVFGCIWDSNYNARICAASETEQIEKMKGSKYVWSNARESYCEVKGNLDKGRQVLFCGLPCQVAGLRNYLSKDYDNLFLLDFLCSGTPSPLAFHKYLDSICSNTEYKDLNLKFRDKNPYGVGVHISYKDKKASPRGEHITNPYYYAFYSHLIDRRSCYHCSYGSDDRISDITVGDYWGIERYHPSLDIKAGISALMVNTEKGEQLIKRVSEQLELTPTELSNISKANNLKIGMKNRNRPIPDRRELFFRELSTGDWHSAKKYIHDKGWLVQYIKVQIPYPIARVLMKLKRK